MKKTQSTAEVADPASSKRRSSRINYDALSKVLDEPLPSNGSKRRRTESDSDQNAGKDSTGTPPLADDEPSAAGENEDDYGWEDPQDYSYYGNQEEEYNEYDDDEF